MVNLQGGMGEAAAEALRSVHSASGLDAARAFYRQLQKLPPVGGTFLHTLLDMEAAVPPAQQLPEPALEAIFEVRASCIASVMCLDSCFSGHGAFTAEVCCLGQKEDSSESEHVYGWVSYSASRTLPFAVKNVAT